MKMLVVFCGGFLGVVCRFLISNLVQGNEPFPLATFLINLAGCFFLAWFLTFAVKGISAELILFVGTGFTGGFTTFSTYSVEVVRLAHSGQLFIGVTYAVLSVIFGLLLSFIGHKLAIGGEVR